MMFGVPASEFLWLVLAILIGGVFTGLLAGLFGIGGGAIVVPILYEVFRIIGVPEEVRMQLCVGTSLAIIVPTSIRSFLAHRARSDLPVDILRIWALPLIAGVGCGGVTAAFAPQWVFKLAFVIISSFMGARLLFKFGQGWVASGFPKTGPMAIVGFIIGLLSALMGVGGGAMSTMFLTMHGLAIHAAVGISAGVGVFISLAGTVGFMLAGLRFHSLMPPLTVGFVSLLGFVFMAPVSSLVAPLGARIAHALTKRQLEIAFGAFLLIVSARLLASLVF